MISQHTPSLRFQAHLAFPQGLPSIQKCQKSLQAHPAQTHGQKDSAAKIERLTREINNETPTHNIKQLGFSGLRAFGSRFNILVGGQERSPKTQPFHIVKRYRALNKRLT
jgi:hypothetical protein